MGKIMVVGTAERKFEADRCKVSFEIETRAKSAAEASKLSSKECERLLTELEKLGIEIRSVVVSSDRIVRRGGYGSEEIAYESEKILSVPFPVNPGFVNEVRSLIEKGFSNVAFSTVYSISNENLLRKELLADAVATPGQRRRYWQSRRSKLSQVLSRQTSRDAMMYMMFPTT